MNKKQLFEMAHADVLGLTDEDERREFEAAFAKAPPEVQAQIRREQLRCARQQHLLPDVEQPAGLRAKVLNYAYEMMAIPDESPAGRIDAHTTRNQRLLRQAPFWRAACFALATACAVLAFFVISVNRQSNDIASMIQNNEFNRRMMEDLSPRFTNVLFSPEMQRLAFGPTAPDAELVIPEAFMYYVPERNAGHIVLRNLPEIQGEYAVRFVDDAGNVVAETPFVNTGGIVPVPLSGVKAGVTFENCEIAAPRGPGGRDRVILKSEGRAGDI